MNKKFYKNSNGAISVFVLMSMLFFLFAMIGIFSIISRRAQTQSESIDTLESKYSVNGQEESILSKRIADEDELIPIYNSEQLFAIGTENKTIEIEGKVYDFSQSDYSKYELKNDIIFDVNMTNNSISGRYKILTDAQYNYTLNKNNYEILYYNNVDNKYYQVARTAETATKINVNVDGVNYRMAVKYLDATKIKADPTTYYGCRVNYQVENSGVNSWKIFYAGSAEKPEYEENDDTDKIYLIADDYIASQYVPKGRNGSSIVPKDTEYCLSMENIINDYSGSNDIASNNLAHMWLKKYIDKSFISTNNNIKAIAYMMDTTKWNKFKVERAYYAIGGPTIELFIASYNATHDNNKKLEVRVDDINGYEIKKMSSSTYSNELPNYINTNETLYVLPTKTITGKANAMWLASPSKNDVDKVMYIDYSGSITNNFYNSSDIGFRPIVCLKDDVVLSRNQDGTYNIK